MTKRPTSERIFDAARALFDQEGEKGLSMRRIATLVGITPMAIYKHFADKDALLNALMLDGFAVWEARVAQIDAPDIVTWLEKFAAAFLEFSITEPHCYEAAFVLNASQARQYPRDFEDNRSPVMREVYRRIADARAGRPLAGGASIVRVRSRFGGIVPRSRVDESSRPLLLGTRIPRVIRARRRSLHKILSHGDTMMIALACALASAVMFYLAFGISDIWCLAWFACAPVLWLAYGPERAWRVAVASFVSFAMGMVYLYQVYGWFMAVPGTVLLVGQSLLFALAVLFGRFVYRRLPPVAALFAFPACWTALEYALGWISPHGAWGAMGYTQVSWPAAIQIASVTGVYGVTFLICLFGSAVALAARKEWRSAGLGVGLCVAVIAGGFLRLETSHGETVRVAALGQISDDSRKAFGGDPVAAAAVAKVYAAGIREAAVQGARIMVTPETDVDLNALAPIEAAAKETNSIVDVGTHGRSPARNMAVVLIPGRSPFVYDKRHRLLPGEAVYKPGTRSGYFGNGLATAICKDLDFPRTIRSDAQAGTRLLIVGADDFGLDGWMHARQAIMRGVENGAAVVRTASRGMATISDEKGRVLASAPVQKPGFVSVVADVPLGRSNTIYKQVGDLFAWLVGLGAIGLAVMSIRSDRRVEVLRISDE